MTGKEKWTVAALVLIAIIYTAIVSFMAEVKIDRLQNRISNMECRHVLYEDGSSVHKDAELSMLCIRNGG